LRDLKQYQDIWTREGILNQPTDYSCVPAAITMLLTEQGFSPTLYEIAEMSGTDTRGTSGSGIIKSGKNYGFDVIHRRLTFDEFMGIGLPGIIMFKHQGLKHAAYISVVREFNLLRVKDSVQGLLHFERDGANEYFGGEIWDCYLFKRGTVLVDQPE
jgi:ABC-type bacteriocin/lantibiotic exporter with double-glycine peptidase domain